MRVPGTAPRAAYHGRVPSWTGSLTAGRRRVAVVVAAAVASLAAATVLVAGLQGAPLHAPNASAVYLVAVVAVAILGGTWAAVACSVAAFLLYDVLFIEPVGSLTVAEPGEWLNLVLFLLVAVAIGQLAALQAARAADAARRARESQALFRISRTLATTDDVAAAAPAVLAGLVTDAGLDRAWLSTLDGARERVVADSAAGSAPPVSATASTLTRRPGD
jgi:K+-sensing histidine kinase KdpD